MSRGIPEPKLTAVDAMIDKLTGAIFVFQIVVVMVLGVAGNVWKDTEARKVCEYAVFYIVCHVFQFSTLHLLHHHLLSLAEFNSASNSSSSLA